MVGKAFLLAALRAVVEEANDGRWPSHLREWRRVGRRLNHGIDWMDPKWGMDAHAVAGVVYVNRWRTRPLIRRLWQLEGELRHEMIETACLYEGTDPICYPPEWGDHHQITVELEGLIVAERQDRLVYGDEIEEMLGSGDIQM